MKSSTLYPSSVGNVRTPCKNHRHRWAKRHGYCRHCLTFYRSVPRHILERDYSREIFEAIYPPGRCVNHPHRRVHTLNYCRECWTYYTRLSPKKLTLVAPDNVRRRLQAERDPASTLHAVLLYSRRGAREK